MQFRRLGNEGAEVSALGLGCMGLTGIYGSGIEAAEGERLIKRAFDLGITLFDSAEIYGPFLNEELVGRALRTVRDQVVIATKFGVVPNVGSADSDGRQMDGRPETVRRSCEASLKRLQTDRIDLYYQHRPDPTVPIEETVGALAELVSEGKVRFIGLSEVTPELVRRAHSVHPISAVQSEYSLWTRDVEVSLLPALHDLGIGFVPYSPLGRGFLTGAIRSSADLASNDWRRTNARFSGENLDHNLGLAQMVRGLADEKGVSAGQVALAWLLSRHPDVVPIPGTTKIARLEENLGALEVTLSHDELTYLDAVFAPGAAAGERYGKVSTQHLQEHLR